MTTRSRAYKLQLSPDGIQLFLRDHFRLCSLAGDLLPHGATLYVAVAALARSSGSDIVACLLDPDLDRFAGRIVRYVGTSPSLSMRVEQVVARAMQNQAIHPAPQVWKVFVAALMMLEEVNDRELAAIFAEASPQIGRSIAGAPG